jgi:hypothetical protein
MNDLLHNTKVFLLWFLILMGVIFCAVLSYGTHYFTRKFQRISNVSLLHCESLIELSAELQAKGRMLEMEQAELEKQRAEFEKQRAALKTKEEKLKKESEK